MRKFVFLLIFIFIASTAGHKEMNKNTLNSVNENTCSLSFYDVDAAHFKYYENDSHIVYWYEWWYANLKGDENIVVMFFTFGDLNNPLLSVIGAFAAFLNENESVEKVVCYPFINYSLDYERCNITIAGNRFYEENGIFYIRYATNDFSLFMKLFPKGKEFGNVSKLKEWQWTAWYVAMPYGNGEAWIEWKGNKYHLKGKGYHDHNWGISKKHDFKWDWGEFGCNNFAIIYGIVKDEEKGGIHFVNDSIHIFIPYGKAKIEYLEWKKINGFSKPTKLHLYGVDKNISMDFYVELERAYI
ncbi:MAG: hypothetical protein DRN11_03620, partial [Thermoplasmata archaeon]